MLSLAGTLVSYMPAFPFSASTFRILNRLDEGFAMLLRTQSPGSHGTGISVVSKTEKVRIKSLAEETRVAVVNATSDNSYAAATQEFSSDEDSEDDDRALEDDVEPYHDEISLSLGRVYKKTLEILGDDLI